MYNFVLVEKKRESKRKKNEERREESDEKGKGEKAMESQEYDVIRRKGQHFENYLERL